MAGDQFKQSEKIASRIVDAFVDDDFVNITRNTGSPSTKFARLSSLVVGIRVYNNSGGTLTKGMPVYNDAWNASGGLPEVEQADASVAGTMPAVGLVYADISNTDQGVVILQGVLRDVDTSAYSIGDTLYVSDTTGTLSTTAGTKRQPIAVVLRSDATNGVLMVVGVGLDEDSYPSGGGGLTDVVDDTSPQLGGMLDVNGNAIGDGTNELIVFVEDTSAVNHLEVENEATGSGPTLRSAGGDTNVDLNFEAKGTGNIRLGVFTLDGDQSVGAGQDNYVLKYDNATGLISLEAETGGGGVSDGDKGDITVSSSGTVWTIDDEAVTLAKMAHIATASILGRDTAGSGDVEVLSASAVRTLLNVEDGATADQTDAEIRAAVEAATDSNVFTDADHSKLNGIEASADVTDAGNVAAAGAVMDSDKAVASDLNTGTSTDKVATADALAGSNFGVRLVQMVVFEGSTDVSTGDGKARIRVPAELDGMNLVSVHAEHTTAGTTGTSDYQIHNIDNALDMLSTKLTVDSGETGSDTAATAAVINTSNDHVNTNDILRIDCDAVSTTAPQGLIITLGFQLP